MRSAAGFHSRMRVSRPNSTSASGEESISACSRSSCALRSVMSVYATMLPTTRPDPSLTGAAAIETATSVPSLRRRTVS